jgi:hypothetical protein
MIISARTSQQIEVEVVSKPHLVLPPLAGLRCDPV